MKRSLVAGFGLLSLTQCNLGEDNKLAAEDTGDLSYALPAEQRMAPDVEQVARCGTGELKGAAGGIIRRRPYLQQITETSALLLFTTTSNEAVVVDVFSPDGTTVASPTATRDGDNGPWIARIEGLEPDTLYCYSLRGMTEAAGFFTASRPDTGKPVRFIAFGDSGTASANQLALRDEMFTVPFDLILHTGDVAYEHGGMGEYEAHVFGVYAPLLRTFPVFPVSGNHDYETAAAAPFRSVFELPENGLPDARERWYSFDWGDVHFVALDTEKIGAAQAAWLESDLAANVRPWVVVYGHRPPFSSGEHGSNGAFRRAFVPILENYRVALALAGHDHDYERTRPLNGVTYVVTGGGGKNTTSVDYSSFTAFSEDATHFVYVVVEETSMTLHAIDGTGREFDSARIERSSAPR